MTDTQGQNHLVSHRYGWSGHNCLCSNIQTGLVLYPTNTRFKNIVLLLCDTCFDYYPGSGNRHEQLMRWYYDIYGATKQFSLVSGFFVQSDGTFQFNSWEQQSPVLYTESVNKMDGCEQDIIRQVVNGQIDSYAA